MCLCVSVSVSVSVCLCVSVCVWGGGELCVCVVREETISFITCSDLTTFRVINICGRAEFIIPHVTDTDIDSLLSISNLEICL